jgi:hypothetical protein
MARPDLRTRQAKAAQAYIQHKGYANVMPERVIQIEGDLCWYFYYDLPDGYLELEVAWEKGDWQYTVTAFQEDLDTMPALAGR